MKRLLGSVMPVLALIWLVAVGFSLGLWVEPLVVGGHSSAPSAEGCYFVRWMDGNGKVHEVRSTEVPSLETGYAPALWYDNAQEWGKFVQVADVMWVGGSKACLKAKGLPVD